jgi:glycosyltransferase involved in cell wall biosynthesis
MVIIGPAPGRQGGVAEVSRHLQRNWTQAGMEVVCLDPGGNAWLSLLGVTRVVFQVHRLARVKQVRAHLNVASRGSTWRKCLVAVGLSKLKVPYVIHLHGGEYRSFLAGLGGLRRRWVETLFRESDAVVVLGDSWADFAREHLRVEMPVVIRNGVAGIPNLKQSAGSGDGLRLAFVGRVGEGKGTFDLIRALGELSNHNWTLEVAGDGNLDQALSEAVAAGISDRVVVHGWCSRREVERILGEADVFVLPSRAEGLPLSLLEAMSAGAVVVATPVGAIPEVITDGENGLLVPPGDVEAIRLALIRILMNPELVRKLGSKAQRDWHNYHSDEKMSAQILSVHGVKI